MNKIIEVKNLTKTYDYFKKEPGLKNSFKNLFKRKKLFKKAVDDISFDINEGEIVGFLGPNGAGKTTTLKMLSGILTPNKGEIKVLDYNPEKREAEYQRQFALVMGQKNQLWWDLPPMESFLLNKEIYGVSKQEFTENLDELVKALKIEDIIDKQVRKLSLGERMKSELVASLLHSPKVLFLDEPTIGLDVIAQKNIRDFLKKYNQKRKTTILLTSHYMEDIVALCDRLIIINEGKIIYNGSINDLMKKYAPNKMITVFFEKEISANELKKLDKVYKIEDCKVLFKVSREEVKNFATKILSSDLPVKDIEISEVDVDSIIRNVFTG
ncbi:ATP-binding cassette domain-containing protein [Candidatus Falkowbacteria bacterium]|jgi:ABC-2 type transport system ATP-binding protein|nr:ATP-binding cassette domain-containing protein [Candidatus Falkowbacteria bacterium]MBT4433401.1 ATP-binding cassette domain-containing protein [Candidatus Falkowbacteria bacterium]